MQKNSTLNIENEFGLNPELIHVNHAAVAPWPVRTLHAIEQFAQENVSQGSLNYLQWVETENALREQLRQLINAPSVQEIALLKSTSEALSVVAYGLDWKAGDSVIIAAEEFPSNKLLWQSLEQYGVEVRVINYAAGDDAEQYLIDAIDSSTRLLSVSAVQYASGRRTDLARLGSYCKQHNVLFCVDAIQALGALQFDVQACHADFVAADGHKWMLGAEGLALFYCRQALLDTLKLNQYGWHMVEKAHDFDATSWEPAHSARRFECGSPNMLGITALHASLGLLLDVGMPQVEECLLANTDYLITELRQIEAVELISATESTLRSGIVIFRHQRMETEALFNHLKAHNVLCAMRGGGIRLSPHFYTAQPTLDRLLDIIRQI